MQLEALAFSETLVLVSQITWGHVRGDLYLPGFFVLFCFVLRPVLIVAKIVCLLHRVRRYQRGCHWTDICEIC